MAEPDVFPGAIFGEWTVLYKTKEKTSEGKYKWRCRCSCGKERSVDPRSLQRGKSKSCGHTRTQKMVEVRQKIAREINEALVGEKFGKLTVLEISDKKDKTGHVLFKCQCECGTIIYTTKYKLETGHTSSCGCIKSKGEEKIAQILGDLQISFSKEIRFSDCKDKKSLPFDFGLYWKNKLVGLIEYNGNIHYRGFNSYWDEDEDGNHSRIDSMKKHDQMKLDYCKSKKIPLLVIPYYEKDVRGKILDFWNSIIK